MFRGVRGSWQAVALMSILAASAVFAVPAGEATPKFGGITANGPDVLADGLTGGPMDPPVGKPSVRVDKNCYFPEEIVTITLKNIGGGRLIFGDIPDYEIHSLTLGTVRQVVNGFRAGDVILMPGESMAMLWDQRWSAKDLNGDWIHLGEFVPEGEYTASVNVPLGAGIETLGRAPFIIGACNVQVSAGDDVFVDEGQSFRLSPNVNVTGANGITSVTWDLDATVDGNGDGNPTNDADVIGETPEITFGDDGAYPVTLNVRGFLPNATVGLKQDAVFTIDSSGSMVWNDPQDLRKAAAKLYADLLVPDDRAAVVDFDTIAFLVNDSHLSTNYALVKENIDRIDSSGGTFIVRGLDVALDELQGYGDPDHIWIVILLTDAESIFEDDEILIPIAITRAQDLGVHIYTVGLNVPIDLVGLMEKIADQTGAKYYPVADPQSLLDIYQTIINEVRKTRGSFFLASDTLTATVRNVVPTADVSSQVMSFGGVDLALRVAGEKWHDVRMTLLRNGLASATAGVTRYPGSPDEQRVILTDVILFQGSTNVVRVVYTPEDDPINGRPNGADPAWVTLATDDGMELRFEHTFNVMHPHTWVWEIDLTGLVTAGGAEATVTRDAADPGSDDLTVAIDWGDGTMETRTYFANGVGPDPFPSPGGGPVAVTDVAVHTYGVAGTFTVTVTVTDDDGGSTVVTFTVDVR